MSHFDDDDETTPPSEPRTEGVRIIGATEAGGTGQPSRRTTRGKRFGDRPSDPTPTSDLPRITINSDPTADPERFGSVPVIRPDMAPPAGIDRPSREPRWADDLAPDDGPGVPEGIVYGEHPEAAFAPHDTYGSVPTGQDPYGSDAEWGEPVVASGAHEHYEDEEFVLPHWTEPATGQVPRVVIGDQPPADNTAFGSQPRWMDPSAADDGGMFDDLMDDAPRLGALADDPGADLDDFFEPSGRVDMVTGATAAVPEPDPTGAAPAVASRAGRNLPMAVGVGVALVALGAACFKLGGLPTAVLVAAILTLCSVEYFTQVRAAGFNPATLIGVVSVLGLGFAPFFETWSAYPVVLGLGMLAGLMWFLVVTPGDSPLQNLGVTVLGVAWIGFLGSFGTLLVGLGQDDITTASPNNQGIGVIIAAVIVVVIHDVSAYFIGRSFGRTPLSAASPNKTQEGLIGGVAVAVLLSTALLSVTGLQPVGDSFPRAFIFCLLCALAAPAGDLVESALKRDLGVKDMGTLLPGHGGVLDRFDAILFVLPVAYFVCQLMGIPPVG